MNLPTKITFRVFFWNSLIAFFLKETYSYWRMKNSYRRTVTVTWEKWTKLTREILATVSKNYWCKNLFKFYEKIILTLELHKRHQKYVTKSFCFSAFLTRMKLTTSLKKLEIAQSRILKKNTMHSRLLWWFLASENGQQITLEKISFSILIWA